MGGGRPREDPTKFDNKSTLYNNDVRASTFSHSFVLDEFCNDFVFNVTVVIIVVVANVWPRRNPWSLAAFCDHPRRRSFDRRATWFSNGGNDERRWRLGDRFSHFIIWRRHALTARRTFIPLSECITRHHRHHHVFIDSWQNATAQETGVHIHKLNNYTKNTLKRVRQWL